jgi:hypothetical protein
VDRGIAAAGSLAVMQAMNLARLCVVGDYDRTVLDQAARW